MEKNELIKKLNDFYGKLESILDDENIRTVGKALTKHLDDFGSFVQDLEDEPNDNQE